jgi:outer membrane protein assembly factor BamB
MAVPTPGGLARLHPDGTMDLHDFGTGEIAFSLKLAPKVGSAPAGAVVHAPGLPKLFVVTEGERHLSAVDLVAGDVRWRHTLSRSGSTCRVRRAGRLLIEASGDLHLTAIDALTGEIVWRLCDKSPFSTAPTFDHDSLFAIAGGVVGSRPHKHRLLSVDAWSGAVRWDAPLPSRVVAASAPLVAGAVIAVVTRGEEGLGLAGFDRATGELRFHLAPGLAPLTTAWLAIDGCVLANTDQGQLLAIDVELGDVKYRRQLTEGGADASPRRLEPILRSGALFVPQREIHVLRPSDGEQLGQVPCDLIPDLLRVDERCDVFVAEESGHVAAFGAGPRLMLVKK